MGPDDDGFRDVYDKLLYYGHIWNNPDNNQSRLSKSISAEEPSWNRCTKYDNIQNDRDL